MKKNDESYIAVSPLGQSSTTEETQQTPYCDNEQLEMQIDNVSESYRLSQASLDFINKIKNPMRDTKSTQNKSFTR